MKLVFDHQIFTLQTYGGISRYFVELGHQLKSQEDIELTFLAPLHINKFLDGMDSRITVGQRIPKIPKTSRLLRQLNNHLSRSWLNKHSPQIIHSTYFFPQGNHFNQNAKVVVTVHDMIHELFPQNFSSSDHTASLKYAAIQKADHVICVSQNTKNDLLGMMAVNPEKVSVVHHGINRIKQEPESGLSFPNPPYLLFVGVREGYKNFSGLLKAYASCTEINTNMKLVCFGGGKFSNREQATHKRLGLGKGQIQWFGGNDRVLASLYKNASAFVYPSLYEGFGMPLLEAMSLGCPVICSNAGPMPEIVQEAGEYFDPHSANGMVEAITRVTNNPSYADVLRGKGDLQIKKFSWRKCAEETFDIYQSLL